jgi:hypothetical protein
MNATGYKILGYAVWRGGKWYLQRTYASKLRRARRGAAVFIGALALTGVIVAIARRG